MFAVTPPPGLCAACRHARRITSARGSRFILCRRSETDPRYPRYPNLPVLACAGFEARVVGDGGEPERPGALDAARRSRLSSADITKNGL